MPKKKSKPSVVVKTSERKSTIAKMTVKGVKVAMTSKSIDTTRTQSVSLSLSIVDALDNKWPIDVITIIVRYARSKSLIVAGGIIGANTPVRECYMIDPSLYLQQRLCTADVGDAKREGKKKVLQYWQSLPSFPKTDLIPDYDQHGWLHDNQMVVSVISYGTVVHEMAITYRLDDMKNDHYSHCDHDTTRSLLSSLPSVSLPLTDATMMKVVKKASSRTPSSNTIMISPPVRAITIDGIIFGASWISSLSSPSISSPLLTLNRKLGSSPIIALNDCFYQFVNQDLYVFDPKTTSLSTSTPISGTPVTIGVTGTVSTTATMMGASSSNEWCVIPGDTNQRNLYWQALPGSCCWRDRIYIIGCDHWNWKSADHAGYTAATNCKNTNRITCWCSTTKQWLPIPNGGKHKRYGGLHAVNIGDHVGILIMMGGTDKGYSPYDHIELFEPQHNRWTVLQWKLPFPVGSFHQRRCCTIYIGDGILCAININGDIWMIHIGDSADDVLKCKTGDWVKMPSLPLRSVHSPTLFAI
jgi:hypothetical protein